MRFLKGPPTPTPKIYSAEKRGFRVAGCVAVPDGWAGGGLTLCAQCMGHGGI